MARNFNGTTQYINIGDNTNIPNAHNLTVFAWIKTTTVAGGVIQNIYDRNARSGGDGSGWRLALTADQLIFTKLAVADIASTTINLTTNTWLFVAAVETSSGVTFYKITPSGTVASQLISDSGAFDNSPVPDTTHIGALVRTGLSTIEWFSGDLAVVGVCSVVLSQNELIEIARGHTKGRSNVAYYPLYGIADPEADLSGFAFNASLVNAPTKADHAPVGRYVPMPRYIPLSVSVTPPQIARPDGDQTLGNWEDDGAGTTDIYQSIDEVTASDSDFIRSENNPSNSKYETTLGNVTDPSISTGHIVRYRYNKNNSNQTIDITVVLKQGVTTIASQTHSNVSTSFTDGSFTLSGAEADNITDYNDLRIEFEADVP